METNSSINRRFFLPSPYKLLFLSISVGYALPHQPFMLVVLLCRSFLAVALSSSFIIMGLNS